MTNTKIIGVLVSVVIFTSLIGVIANQVAGVGGNVTGASLIMVGLITLFVVIGFILYIVKQAK